MSTSALKEAQKENSSLKKRLKQGDDRISEIETKYKNLLEEMKKLKETHSTNASTQENDTVTPQLQKTLDELITQTSVANETVASIKNDRDALRKDIGNHESRIENLAQYFRVNSLLIHNLKDVPKNCHGYDFGLYLVNKLNQLLADRLRFEVTIWHLEYAHILPTKNNIKPVVIVKFKSRFMKYDIFDNRSKLKGTGISITEHLTVYNLQLLKEARDVVGFENVWTSQNKILANLEGNIHRISSPDDIVSLKEKCAEAFPDGLPENYKAPSKNKKERPRRSQGQYRFQHQGNSFHSKQSFTNNMNMTSGYMPYNQVPNFNPYHQQPHTSNYFGSQLSPGQLNYNDRSANGFPGLEQPGQN